MKAGLASVVALVSGLAGPQKGFVSCILRTRLRISTRVRGRPHALGRDFQRE